MDGRYLGKTNELVNMRKKKRMIRRTILFLSFLITILITLCLKLSYFNVESIIVENNRNISGDLVSTLSGIESGNNIFYINVKKVRTNILSNPYILNVVLKRKLPGTVILRVEERDAFYYFMKNKDFIILDSKGRVLEIRNSIDGMKLVKVDGLNPAEFLLGEVVAPDDMRKISVLKQIGELSQHNSSGFNFTALELGSMVNMSLYLSEIRVKLGNGENLEEKLNKALNIMVNNNLKNAKGYIDVSFEGNPVLYIER